MAFQTSEANRNKVRAKSSEDWEPFKENIETLYKSMTLKDLMKEMENRHDFQATQDQYKNMLRKWGLDNKRIKGIEYKAMIKRSVARRKEVPSKETQFTLRGKEVDQGKIDRFKKRAKVSDEDTFSDIVTPSSLIYETPAWSSASNDSSKTTLPNQGQPIQPNLPHISQDQQDLPRLSPSPSNSVSDWWNDFVNYRSRSPSILSERAGRLQLISPHLKQLISFIDDLGRSEIFLDVTPTNESLADFLRSMAICLERYEDQAQYRQLAQRADINKCSGCWIRSYAEILESNYTQFNRETKLKYLGAGINDLFFRGRVAPIASPVSFLLILAEACQRLKIYDMAVSLFILGLHMMRLTLSTADINSATLLQTMMRLAKCLADLGEIELAHHVLQAKEFRKFSEITAYATFIPCGHCKGAFVEYRDEFSDIVSIFSTASELKNDDTSWLDQPREMELRFEYAWTKYQLDRRLKVLIALTPIEDACDWMKRVWNSRLNIIVSESHVEDYDDYEDREDSRIMI